MAHLTRANYRVLQRRMDRSIPGGNDSETFCLRADPVPFAVKHSGVRCHYVE